MGLLADYIWERHFQIRTEHRSVSDGLASLGRFMRSIGEELSYPDFLPPMFWKTCTITNPTKATVEVWGSLVGTIVLGPGEERTVAIPAGEHLSIAKTTAPGSLTITTSQ